MNPIAFLKGLCVLGENIGELVTLIFSFLLCMANKARKEVETSTIKFLKQVSSRLLTIGPSMK